jgi:hypothetical protein
MTSEVLTAVFELRTLDKSYNAGSHVATNFSEQHGTLIFTVKQTFSSTLKETACSSNLPKYTASHPMKQSFLQPPSLSLEATHKVEKVTLTNE